MAAREVACERRVMRMVVVVSLLAALGCSTSKPATAPMPKSEPAPVVEAEPAPAPPPGSLTDAEFEDLMTKTVAMFEAMGSAVDAAGPDCGKTADALNGVFDANTALLADLKRFEDDQVRKKRGEKWMMGHMDEIMGPMMKVGTASRLCESDPGFQRFQERFDDMK